MGGVRGEGKQLCGHMSRFAFVLLAVVACDAELVGGVMPTARAKPFMALAPRNQDRVIKLLSEQYIPDGGEITWPIYVEDTGSVKSVRVELRGAFHPWASDLRIKLHHAETAVHQEGNAVTLVSQGTQQANGQPHVLGEPDDFDLAIDGSALPDPSGVGYDYAWHDEMGTNLAEGKTATQSTTSFGGDASRAVDGNVNGYYSSESVTHTRATGTRVALDAYPWWEVDLDEGDAQNIGTIKLWNRQQEANRDEVQVVTTSAAGILAGSFTLSMEHNGVTTTTGAISVNAVANKRDEDPSSSTAGVGLGESMQAKLQALSNLNSVRVRRSDPDARGGYSWTITFVSEPGDLNELTVASNDITSAVPSVTVRTSQDGNSNVYYNYDNQVVQITGSLFPCWVMMYDEATGSPGDVDLDTAKSTAKWRKRLATEQRETTLVLPANTTGRYIRVQSESEVLPMSIAEVQVYEARFSSFRTYEGGSPMSATDYQSEKSLDEAFKNAEMFGHWTLTIRDTVVGTISETTTSKPRAPINGRGGFDSWILQITDTDDNVYRYETALQAVVTTLPIYGTLYYYDVATEGRGVEIVAVEGQERYEQQCYDNCAADFEVGAGYSTTKDGSVALPTNRLRPFTQDRSVVYVPNDDFLGRDSFNYVVHVNAAVSTRAKVDIDVRKCRIRDDCLYDVTSDYISHRRNV